MCDSWTSAMTGLSFGHHHRSHVGREPGPRFFCAWAVDNCSHHCKTQWLFHLDSKPWLWIDLTWIERIYHSTYLRIYDSPAVLLSRYPNTQKSAFLDWLALAWSITSITCHRGHKCLALDIDESLIPRWSDVHITKITQLRIKLDQNLVPEL